MSDSRDGDALSEITENPADDYAADLIVRAVGSVLLSEVAEVRDEIHLLMARAVNEEVRLTLLREIAWYD